MQTLDVLVVGGGHAGVEAACAAVKQKLTLRRQPGHDHSYYFIQTFIGDHLAFHRERLD